MGYSSLPLKKYQVDRTFTVNRDNDWVYLRGILNGALSRFFCCNLCVVIQSVHELENRGNLRNFFVGNKPNNHPQNVSGRFYVTEDCLACETCQSVAPKNFRYGDNGLSYVFKQPSTPEELDQCEEAVAGCPLEAVRDDGH